MSEAVIDTTLNIMALPAVRANLDSIGLSDPDLLVSIAETVDGWEKGIQAFETIATCPAGTFASLREHLLNHRRLVLDLGPATFDKVLFDFRVRSPTYVVDAAPSSTSVASVFCSSSYLTWPPYAGKASQDHILNTIASEFHFTQAFRATSMRV